uniref:Uncharacterized protein n=1 Tax=Acrobeloides nanus TaxID=290746 RepID=A0A914CNC9_9BILA
MTLLQLGEKLLLPDDEFEAWIIELGLLNRRQKKVNQLNELQKEYLEKENAKLDLIEQARSRCLELFGQLED